MREPRKTGYSIDDINPTKTYNGIMKGPSLEEMYGKKDEKKSSSNYKLEILDIPKKYHRRRKQLEHKKQKVKAIVYHYTQGHSIQSSFYYVFKESTKGASAHYWIARDGRVFRAHSCDTYVYHAGTNKSCKRKGRYGSSRDKVGIEIALWMDPETKKWEEIHPAQVEAVIALTKYIENKYGKLKKYFHGDQRHWCKDLGEGEVAMSELPTRNVVANRLLSGTVGTLKVST